MWIWGSRLLPPAVSMERLNRTRLRFGRPADGSKEGRCGALRRISSLKTQTEILSGSRVVDEVIASVVPGINRALDCCRAVAVQGSDIYGASQVCHVRVADIGPLLVLKLNAFGGPSGRRLPKDAYDILLAVTAFIDGPTAAIKSFQAEEATGNRAYQIATTVWNELT
jgi:hypothetical protein